MSQSSINVKDDVYLDYVKKELATAGIEPLAKVMQYLGGLTKVFYDAGHSGSSAGYGTMSTIWAISVVQEAITKEGIDNPDWLYLYNSITDGSVDKIDAMKKGPDKWILEANIKSLKTLKGVTFTDEEFEQLVHYFKMGTRFEPITPLTGGAEEWFDHDDVVRQNKRLSSVFGVDRQEDGSSKQGYDLEGVVFSDNKGITWFTCGLSRRIFNFPYDGSEAPMYVLIKPTDDDKRGEPDHCVLNPATEVKIGTKLLHYTMGTVEVVDVCDDTFTIVVSGGIRKTFPRSQIGEILDISYDYDLSKENKDTANLRVAIWSKTPGEAEREEWENYVIERDAKEREAYQNLRKGRIGEVAAKIGCSLEEAEKRMAEEEARYIEETIGRVSETIGVEASPVEPVSDTDKL